jgi:hypothetical protein
LVRAGDGKNDNLFFTVYVLEARSIVFDGLSFVKLIRDNWRLALMPFSCSA